MISKQEVVYYVQLAKAIKVISTEAEHEAVSSSRIMKKSLHRHCRKSWKERLKIMSSDDSRKLAAGAVQTWDGVVVRSRHVQRRPEKLDRRQSTTVYDGR